MSGHPKPLRTVDARPSHNTMIKPGELIDVVEMSPLTLTDRRVYNTLIANAWDKIEQPATHVIAKKDLRGSRDQNDRVGESIERLMAAIARLEIVREGKRYIRRVQLLGATDEGREDDGLLYYRFPAELRAIIRNSSIFARLRMDVIFALSSKYALALYELVQKRGNLEWQNSEEFTIERFRQLLGVESGKLESFKNLNKWAIQPAALEVNALSDFGCKVKPVLAGRKVVKIRLSWWRKNENELKAAYRELQAAKVGRRARMKGTVEQTVPSPARIADKPANLEPTPVDEHADDFVPEVFEHLLRSDSSKAVYTLPGGTHKVLVLGPAPGVTPSPNADIMAVLREILDVVSKPPPSRATDPTRE